MVSLTRITGAQFALNPDLIERVDRTPDTVITLVDGTKYLVGESLDEVVLAVLDYRAQVLAAASGLERAPSTAPCAPAPAVPARGGAGRRPATRAGSRLMDRATLIGLGLGLVAILLANVLEGGKPTSMLLVPPMILVFGGTIGAAVAGGTMDDAKAAASP